MGVFGLQSFMESNESLFEPVSLPEIAEKYRNEMKKDPVMLVDIASFVIHLTDGNETLQFLSGGLKQFKENFETFLNNCFKLGIKLKIFGEGMKPYVKMRNWEKKSNFDIRSLERFYTQFECTLRTLEKNKELMKSGILYILIRIGVACCVSSHKCEFVRSLYEADYDIIRLARKECFAILSSDSDFVVAEGARYCLSAKKIDLGSMMMYNYNRNNLLKLLNISSSQLLIFGALWSNVYVNIQKKFYGHRFTKQHKYLEVAKKIKNLSIEEIFENPTELKNALQMSHYEVVCLKNGLKVLLGCNVLEGIHTTESENWNKIMALAVERHRMGILPNLVLTVMVRKTVHINAGMGNVFKPGCVTGLRALREKIYGIIFFEYPQAKICVNETSVLCRKKGVSAKVETYKVSFYRRFHPGLIELWSIDSTDRRTRLKVFCQTLHWKITPEDIQLMNIPEKLLFPLFVGFYLLWESHIKIQPIKIKILLIHSVLVHSLSAKEIEEYPIEFHIHAWDLSDWYLQTLELLHILNAICGEPFNKDEIGLENYFDGRILQYMYGKIYKKNEDISSLHPEVWAQYMNLRGKLYQLAIKCGHISPEECVNEEYPTAGPSRKYFF